MLGRSPTGSAPRGSRAGVVGGFFLLGLLGILRHEMWRDELEIWLIARDSGSFLELLANMGSEAHPVLWYALSFVLSRFTRDPVALQLLSLLVGTGTAWLVMRYAPFSWVQRALLCLGYYALFELTVISRNYGIVLLLTFAFCALYGREKRLEWRGGVLLALLANAHLFGAMTAATLVLLDTVRGWRSDGLVGWLRDRGRLLGLAIVSLGVLVGTVHTYVQYRAIGPGHLTVYEPGFDLSWFVRGLATLYYGFVPLPDPTTATVWNTNIVQLLPGGLGSAMAGMLSLGVIAGCAFALRNRPVVHAVFWLGIGLRMFVTYFVWYGYVRHHGQLFLWFVTCCWLAAALGDGAARAGREARRFALPTWPLTAVLAAQLVAGAFVYVQDLARPFSSAAAVAGYLSGPEYRDHVLVGSADYAMQSVVGYLDRPIFYPESDRFGTFVDWSDARREVPMDKVLADALALRRAHGEVVLILNQPPRMGRIGDVLSVEQDTRMIYIAAFRGSMIADEDFHLYRLVPAPADPTP